MITGKGFAWIRRIGLTVLALFAIAPLYAMLLTAFEPSSDVAQQFRWIPRHVTLAAFREMWSSVPLAQYLRNSLEVSGLVTVLVLLLAIPAAYALARFRFIGRRPFGLLLLATQTVPGTLFVVPLFLLFAKIDRDTGLGLIGSIYGLVLVLTAFTLPFAVMTLANFFASMPLRVEETAASLGAGPMRTLIQIVLPNAREGLAIVAFFAFYLSWGEVLFCSILSTNQSATLAVGLTGFVSDSGVQWNQLMAAAILASAPVLVLFWVLRRYLVAGLARSI